MNKIRVILPLLAMIFTFAGCTNHNLIDINQSISANNWTYAKSVSATLDIKDVNQPYHIYFKLRHTTDYRYSNLFVMMHLKGEGINKNIRYQFKLAKADGEWLGKGSGAIYSYNFPLLKNYRFAKPGKYELEITQNMRDNPLVGMSDVGLTVTENIK